MNTVLPKIEATGDESLLEVVPVASIIGTHQPAADPMPLTPPPSSPAEAPSSPVDKPQPYTSLSQMEIDNFLERPHTIMGVTLFTYYLPFIGSIMNVPIVIAAWHVKLVVCLPIANSSIFSFKT